MLAGRFRPLGRSMKKLRISLVLFAVSLPSLAPWQRWNLSPDNPQRFDSYYVGRDGSEPDPWRVSF
jgi:hypothetical protein